MIVILMGPTGAGKTTDGELLARKLGWQFADADDFHSPANVEKMSKGIALSDEDRAPWLATLHEMIAAWAASGKNAVLACSALKKKYREQLTPGPEVKWVYLKGTYEEISSRLETRLGHYAGQNLLASQFETLEVPSDALIVNVAHTPQEIVEEITKRLGLA
jgi:gluconokinase